MSTRRAQAKQPNAQLNRQLLERETYIKLQEEKRKKSLRKADICTDLSKLVFASVILGGLFENVAHPYLLFGAGCIGFTVLLWYGNRYFEKGIKE